MLNLNRPAPATGLAAGGVFADLDADWALLCADTSVRMAVTDWLTTDRLAEGVAAVTDSWVRALGPAELLAALRPPAGALSDELTDAVLRSLLERAAGHDRSAILAGRIVVQAMIPAAVRMTRGQVRPFGGRRFDDVAPMVIAALYEVARSGRIHARPGRPAANLALDALRRVCRELAAEREERGEDLAAAEDLADPSPGPDEYVAGREVRTAAAAAGLSAGGDPFAEEQTHSARLELLDLVLDAMENGTLCGADARAIAWHYASIPVPDSRAAAVVGTTPAAWQQRRSRALGRLRSAHRRAA
ncbi:hypothetical protein [Streptomyces sp. NBC_01465]|uniref:hypothetical protein n=1 Tax=Streptomyces sp. NBC_01465 TaxID=2903878 RepID=UPI002E2F59D9|nr:hypothetical protein [Streptomyces sp. NBC_01465]